MAGRRGIGVGAAALALILIVIAFLLDRASAGGGRQSSPSPGQTGGQAGPTRTVAGLPVGYAHSRAGAVAAAANYGVALAGPLFLDDARRAAVIRQIGTPGYVERTLPAAASAVWQLKASLIGKGLRQGAGTVYEGAPLAYRVVSYATAQARVQIWASRCWVATPACSRRRRPEPPRRRCAGKTATGSSTPPQATRGHTGPLARPDADAGLGVRAADAAPEGVPLCAVARCSSPSCLPSPRG